jgi:hypothetical protein
MRLWDAEQRAAMTGAVERAAAGSPTVLVVEGEPGTGKTSVLDEVVDLAGGFRVLAADGLDTGDSAPYDVLAQWGIPVPPESSPLTAGQQLRTAVDAAGGPLLLRVDDLQWADPESVTALLGLVSRAAGDRLLVAVGTRPSAAHPAWRRWTGGRDRAVHLVLTGLSPAATGALAEALRPGLIPAAAQALWEHTGGNPFYLTALLTEYDVATLSEPRRLPAPAEFTALVRTRTSRLNPAALAVLEAATVLGAGWVPLRDVVELAEVADPAAAVQELVDADLLARRDFPEQLRIPHGLVRAAVRELTPLPRLRLLHQRAAALVTDRAAVLEHRIAATDGYDDALAGDLEAFAHQLHQQRSHRLAAATLVSASVLSRDPAYGNGAGWTRSSTRCSPSTRSRCGTTSRPCAAPATPGGGLSSRAAWPSWSGAGGTGSGSWPRPSPPRPTRRCATASACCSRGAR